MYSSPFFRTQKSEYSNSRTSACTIEILSISSSFNRRKNRVFKATRLSSTTPILKKNPESYPPGFTFHATLPLKQAGHNRKLRPPSSRIVKSFIPISLFPSNVYNNINFPPIKQIILNKQQKQVDFIINFIQFIFFKESSVAIWQVRVLK